jgi:prefoldin subunit 5
MSNREEIMRLIDERDALRAKVDLIRKEYDAVNAEIAPLEERRQEIRKRLIAAKGDKLVDVEKKLAALARATGGHVLSR